MHNPRNVQALNLFARLAAGSSVRRSDAFIRRLDDGHQIGVQFPFLLKHLFKQSFPGAQWEPERRCWTIPAYQSDRLAEWIEIVEQSGLLDDLHANEAQLHEDAEVAALRAELDALRAEAKARLAEVIEKERRQYRADLKADIELLREVVH